jgi:hypothetical protein
MLDQTGPVVCRVAEGGVDALWNENAAGVDSGAAVEKETWD